MLVGYIFKIINEWFFFWFWFYVEEDECFLWFIFYVIIKFKYYGEGEYKVKLMEVCINSDKILVLSFIV